jgi:flagella basal body P-ring formation protein FlgA
MTARFVVALFLVTPAFAGEPVVLTLSDRAAPPAPVVTVGHVATLNGGDAKVREKMAALDLTDRGDGVVVSRRQLTYRLRLAGFDADAFVVTGADKTTLGVPKATLSVEKVVAVARVELAKALGKPLDELTIDLDQKVQIKLPEVMDDDDVAITAMPNSPAVRPGRTQMNMTVSVNGGKKLQFAVYLTAAVGGVEADPVSPPRAKPAGGKFAADAVVVRALQPVAMVATNGGLRVSVAGVAMQDGKVGQEIKVRNSDSKKIVTGTVVGANEVEIAVGGSR